MTNLDKLIQKADNWPYSEPLSIQEFGVLINALKRLKKLDDLNQRSGCLLADYEDLQKKFKSLQDTHGSLLIALDYNRKERDQLKQQLLSAHSQSPPTLTPLEKEYSNLPLHCPFSYLINK